MRWSTEPSVSSVRLTWKFRHGFWRGAINDAPPLPTLPRWLPAAAEILHNRAKRWAPGSQGRARRARRGIATKGLYHRTVSSYHFSPLMGGRVRKDNVWRSTLSSKREPDKDSAYTEWKKTSRPWPATSDSGILKHSCTQCLMLTTVSKHKSL